MEGIFASQYKILDYQKDINKTCDENIPKTIIKYETTKPIGKAELKK